MKTNLVAYLLWIFLGFIGAHKFYVNKSGMGVLYIALFAIGTATTGIIIGFFLLGILGILEIIDLFTIPSQVQKANEGTATAVGKYQAAVEKAKTDSFENA